MFKRIGCAYSLVGHSERRHIFHETNREVRKKMEAILADGLTPVLCVGETIEERRSGQTEKVVEIQLRAALGDLKWPKGRKLFIAYEPVWAIGTGLACDADEAERMHKLIQKLAKGLVAGADPVFLYGGSVRPENVAEYLIKEPIHGILVGGASVKLESWLKIIRAVFN
jgi:triosephosphate isomerase